MDKLLELALRQQTWLERLKAGQTRSLKSVMAALRARIGEILGALVVTTLDKLTKRELNKALQQLNAAYIEAMGGEMNRALEDLADVAGWVSGSEAAALSALTKTSFAAVSAEEAYKVALALPLNVKGFEGGLLQDFVTGWPPVHAQIFSQTIRLGWERGWTVKEMRNYLVGTKGLNFTDGQLVKSERDANAILHTAAQHVANSSRQAFYAANGDLVIGYTFVATLDSHTTQVCRSLDGTSYKLDEGGPQPPMHVRCRSTTKPKLGPEFDFLQTGGTRASSGENPGQIDAKKRYYDFLKTQSADFQDGAIGATRGKLLREGGLSANEFAALNINETFEPLTLREMAAINPEAFRRAGLDGYLN